MNTDNNNLDDILRKLDSFDPQVKPDWEAFLAENKSKLPHLQSSNTQKSGLTGKSSTTLRNSSIAVAILIGLFCAYYFIAEPKQQTILNENTEKQADEFPLPAGEIIPATNYDNPVQIVDPASIIKINEILNSSSDKYPETEKVIPVIPEIPQDTDVNTDIDISTENENSGAAEIAPKDSAQNVIIRRTVIIRDTVKIKREIRNKTK